MASYDTDESIAEEEERQSAKAARKPVIGISIGDLNGVGPEVVLKTFSDPRMMELCSPVIFASENVVAFYNNTLPDKDFVYHTTRDLTALHPTRPSLFPCWDEDVSLQPGALTDTGGKYAVRSLLVAAQCLRDGQLDALVTAPIHKGNTRLHDFPHTGHTPFLKEKFGAKDVVMLLYNGALRMALATEHIPVSGVAAALTKEVVQSKLQILFDSLVKDFGIAKPRIAILGLNPHAGDEGQIGSEEAAVLKPLAEQWQSHGHLVYGPFSADAFFARRSYENFDAILAMYHDQGLVPFKMLALGEGVNFTAGLPVVRTSPDHGTAFDIAGRGIADPQSFREAVFAAIDFVRARADHAEGTANPLQRSKGKRERSLGNTYTKRDSAGPSGEE
jgi:4-hydroxythreonine-4-phosphate dehydrogenase